MELAQRDQREKWRISAAKYRATARGKIVKAAYNASPGHKAKFQEYVKSERGKDAERRYLAKTTERRAAYRHEYNKTEKRKEQRRKYYEKEHSKALLRAWQASERYKATNKLYLVSEKGRAARNRGNAKRRALGRRIVATLTSVQWLEIKDLYDHSCVYCGKWYAALTQDHVIPISKGGHHIKENIVPACRSCNSKKHTGSLPFILERRA
jgi:5-methylcytosine-specific restriction endonuclease McrA